VNAQVRQWVRDARRIVVLSGAGISAESGVPTFRDAQTGLWAKFRPEQLATEEAFRAVHQRAGSPGVLALHANIADDKWLDAPRACCDTANPQPGHPPRCAVCGNLRRPAVVWFGEMLPIMELAAAEQAAAACDLMLVVGTSGVVYPAAGLARATRGRVAIVNPEPTELDDAADAVLTGTAARLLPELLED
jgi:NAD-dependent deacetylase